MYALYRQTDPPTAVDNAICCKFIGDNEKHLIISGGSHLRVFRLNPFVPIPSDRNDRQQSHQEQQHGERIGGRTSRNYTTRLECVLQYQLSGNVISMAAARLPQYDSDALFLAFGEAKLSVVRYDPEVHDLAVISLHCFEDDILRNGFTRCDAGPYAGASCLVRVDPDNRCAAMLVYGRHLAVVPLSRDVLFGDELDSGDPKSNKSATLHSYTVPLEQIDPKLQNVADLCFLHGYYEPTLLFLYEPIQTTAGRVAVRQDTYCILAVSMNAKDRLHAVIWTVNCLPFDCFRALAVPKPIGGVVVFAVNSTVYLNQSIPPYGVILNANSREASSFPLRSMEDKRIQLDASVADFLSPNTLLLALRNGELHVMTLLVDNMNAVKGMHFDQCQSSVIPSVACKCGEGYVFVGSRLGNSQLLKFTEVNSVAMKVATEPHKRERTGDDNDHVERMEDDLELYGEVVAVGSLESVRVSQYAFEQTDSLLNVGPCRAMVFGEPVTLTDDFNSNVDPVVDLVTAAGHSTNGCLVQLQRSVRPQVLTTSLIQGAQRLWTVGCADGGIDDEYGELNGGDNVLPGAHRHLLLSKDSSTMVLELKSEISELESSDFIMDQRTIAAGSLKDGRFTVQVTPTVAILFREARAVQQVTFDVDFPVCQASIADPYVVLLTESGEILLLTLATDALYEYFDLVISQPAIRQDFQATAIAAYKDLSGMFVTQTERSVDDGDFDDEMDTKTFGGQPHIKNKSGKSGVDFSDDFSQALLGGTTADDEDALLYGDAASMPKKAFDTPPVKPELPFNRRDPRFNDVLFDRAVWKGGTCQDPSTCMPTFWVAVARENGLLEIFSLPDFKLLYMVKKFPVGFGTLFDTDPIKLALEQDKADDKFSPVRELLLVGLGANKCRPHLMAVVDEELLIYEAFPYATAATDDHLRLRFKRLKLCVNLKNSRAQRAFRRRADGSLSSMAGLSSDLAQRLYTFDNVSGYSGVFVAGAYPYWLFMTPQGVLRCHPMHIDGKVVAFSSFHNVNCENGFIYINDKREMRICQLQPLVDYDASCPTHKVDLNCTAHNLVYHLDSRTYAVTVSYRIPSKTMVTLVGDDKQFETFDKEDPNFIYPTTEKFKVQLYSSETWEPVPEAEIDFEDFERVTVLKEVQLKSEGTRSGLQSYLAIGTIHNYGEEVLVRGRIFIVDVVEVVPEPGQPLTKNKLKVLYAKEQKGPVTSLCSVQGYLLTGMGQKVYIWSFKDNDLVGISFLDLQIYIHQIIAIRNIALVGDVFRSVCLLRYQESCKALSLASRDPRHTEVYAMEFLIDNKSMGFLVSDADGNVYVYMYQPEAKESLGGQRLIRRADINVGCRLAAFARIRCHVGDPLIEKKVEAANRHLSLFGTVDGGMGYFMPLQEKVYRRLLMLQNILITGIGHTAGLNPRAFRAIRHQGNALMNPQKNILDGDLLFAYLHLSIAEKVDISKRIGTTREQLQDDLLEIDRLSTHF